MHILQVTPRYPPHSGGVENHVAAISERLVSRGHDVTVFTADASRDLPREHTENGVSIRRFRSLSPGSAFHVSPSIGTAVYRTTADVVHAHNYHSVPLFFAALGSQESRLVVTTHYHGASARSLRNSLLRLYQPIGNWVLNTADEVIAVSEWESEQLLKDFGVDATVIPNGLKIERFSDATPFQRERPYLLYVGRLKEYKGIQSVIRALPQLPEYDFLIAGSGSYREQLKQIAEAQDVEKQVEFLGYVDSDQLPGLYKGAELFLLLSKFEAFGLTVAEALASGTPCLIRSGSALEDWTANAGVSVLKSPSPSDLPAAVRNASEQTPDNTGIVHWETVVDEIIEKYDPN